MHYNMKSEILIKVGKEVLRSLLTLCDYKEMRMIKLMYLPSNLDGSIDDIVNNIHRSRLEYAIRQCEGMLKKGERPYLIGTIEVEIKHKFNPNYGDERECECGHSYYRHFDSYEDMSPVGCKYCGCYHFKEKTN